MIGCNLLGDISEELVTQEKQKKTWRMNCDIGEAMEGLENEQSSFSNLSVTSPTSQLILQPFRRFTHVTVHSPTLPSLHLRHSSFSNHSVALPTSQFILQPFRCFTYVTAFSNPSFASPTSQALHLRHLAIRPWTWIASLCRESVPPGIITTVWHSSPPLCHSLNADGDRTGISRGVRKDGNHWAGFPHKLHKVFRNDG